MNKIYAFLIILPIIALLIFRTVAFYDFDTKQRYVKNSVDSAAHKAMITGVYTALDKSQLVKKLNQLGSFNEADILLQYGAVNTDGQLSELVPYTPGDILQRGQVFKITVMSHDVSLLSQMKNNNEGSGKLYFKAQALCRIEKRYES